MSLKGVLQITLLLVASGGNADCFDVRSTCARPAASTVPQSIVGAARATRLARSKHRHSRNVISFNNNRGFI